MLLWLSCKLKIRQISSKTQGMVKNFNRGIESQSLAFYKLKRIPD